MIHWPIIHRHDLPCLMSKKNTFRVVVQWMLVSVISYVAQWSHALCPWEPNVIVLASYQYEQGNWSHRRLFYFPDCRHVVVRVHSQCTCRPFAHIRLEHEFATCLLLRNWRFSPIQTNLYASWQSITLSQSKRGRRVIIMTTKSALHGDDREEA